MKIKVFLFFFQPPSVKHGTGMSILGETSSLGLELIFLSRVKYCVIAHSRVDGTKNLYNESENCSNERKIKKCLTIFFASLGRWGDKEGIWVNVCKSPRWHWTMMKSHLGMTVIQKVEIKICAAFKEMRLSNKSRSYFRCEILDCFVACKIWLIWNRENNSRTVTLFRNRNLGCFCSLIGFWKSA